MDPGNILPDPAKEQPEKELKILSAIVSKMAESVCMIGANDTVIIYANPMCEKSFGYGSGEMAGMLLSNLICGPGEKDTEVISRIKNELLSNGETIVDVQNVKKDGTLFWCKAHLTRMEHPEFGLVWIAIYKDITGIKETEKIILEEHNLVKKLVSVRDLKTTLGFCLEAAIRISGMECGALYLTDESGGLRLSCSRGLSEPFRTATSYYPKTSTNTRLVMQGNPVYVIYSELNGPLSKVELKEGLQTIAVLPIFFEQKIIGCMNLASRSIHEFSSSNRSAMETIASGSALLIVRARADEAHMESIALFKTLVEHIKAISYIARIDKTSTTVYISPQVNSIFGFTQEEFNADPDLWHRRIHPDDRKRVLEKVRSCHQHHHDFECEYRMIKKTGEIIWFRDSAALIKDHNDNPVSLLGVMSDVTGQKAIEEDLQNKTQQLQGLAAHVHTVLEEERKKIAREIHDEFGQSLSALKMNLSSIKHTINASPAFSQKQEVLEELFGCVGIISDTIFKMRTLVTELRPEVLEVYGLVPALKWMAGEFSKKNFPNCHFMSEGPEPCFSAADGIHVFRIVQEALVNIRKHSDATKVKIELRNEKEEACLKISDNGKGFVPDAVDFTQSFGLLGMKERAEMLGARLTIESASGQGTIITINNLKPTQ